MNTLKTDYSNISNIKIPYKKNMRLNMKDRITITGRIGFEPEDKTNKHLLQSSWKKIAMVFINGDICEYYSWFIKKKDMVFFLIPP